MYKKESVENEQKGARVKIELSILITAHYCLEGLFKNKVKRET